MKDEKGYMQAVQNYAYQMAKISDMMPQNLKDAMPTTEDFEALDGGQEALDEFMNAIQVTPEMDRAFNKMEAIAEVIADSYDVPLETVHADTMIAGLELAVAQAQAEFFNDAGSLH